MTEKVYIACSMIKAKQLDFSLLDLLIDYVKGQDYVPFVPGKMKDTSPKEVFTRDMNWLRQSERIIADLNEPSHGVGMEIMYAHEKNIPVVGIVNKKNLPISRMVEGSPNTILIFYNSKKDLMSKLRKIKLKHLKIQICDKCSKKTIHLENICKKC